MEASGMHEIVQDHERRIVELERNQAELKNGMLRIENTVLQESSKQTDLLNKLIDHHFSNKSELIKSKGLVISSLIGSGGILVLFVQWLISQL